MEKIKKYEPSLQSFSGIAIIFVVFIHANSYYLLSVLKKTSYEEVYFTTRLLDNFIHGAVPMFIFISGYKYILNDINKSYKEYSIRRIKRVIKPFLIISMIFFLKDIVVNYKSLNIKIDITNFLKIFIGYNIAYQLWYIPMYIFISLTYPIIYKLLKNEKIRILFILFIVVIQYYVSWHSELIASHPFDFIYYYIFFEMGVIFYKYDIVYKFKKYNVLIIAIYVALAFIVTLNPLNEIVGHLKKFMLWPMSVVAYYFLNSKIQDNKLLQYLGENSFYIFLLHEPIICTQLSYLFKSLGIYNFVGYVFIIAILTIIITLMFYNGYMHLKNSILNFFNLTLRRNR